MFSNLYLSFYALNILYHFSPRFFSAAFLQDFRGVDNQEDPAGECTQQRYLVTVNLQCFILLHVQRHCFPHCFFCSCACSHSFSFLFLFLSLSYNSADYSNQVPLLRAFSRRIFLIVYTSEILKKSYRKEARRDMIQNIKCIEC